MKKWQRLGTKIAFDGSPHFAIHQDKVKTADGTVVEPFYRLEAKDFVLIIPVTPNEELVFVEQYRNGIDEISLELPAGAAEKGETLQAAAIRELREETGYTTDNMIELIPDLAANPAFNTNRFSVFLAQNAQRTHDQDLDTTEDIVTREIPLAQAVEDAFSGKILHCPTIIGILATARHLRLLIDAP